MKHPPAAELRKFGCARCGASPGQVCKGIVLSGNVGKNSVRPHAERIREYEKKKGTRK